MPKDATKSQKALKQVSCLCKKCEGKMVSERTASKHSKEGREEVLRRAFGEFPSVQEQSQGSSSAAPRQQIPPLRVQPSASTSLSTFDHDQVC